MNSGSFGIPEHEKLSRDGAAGQHQQGVFRFPARIGGPRPLGGDTSGGRGACGPWRPSLAPGDAWGSCLCRAVRPAHWRPSLARWRPRRSAVQPMCLRPLSPGLAATEYYSRSAPAPGATRGWLAPLLARLRHLAVCSLIHCSFFPPSPERVLPPILADSPSYLLIYLAGSVVCVLMDSML